MPDGRMEVIIEEIRYWRSHQLLPEVYCDYLLALYTKGENELEPDVDNEHKRNAFTITATIQLILVFFMIPISILIMYVLPYILIGKTVILLLLIGYVGWTLLYFKRRDMIFVHFSLMVLFLLILLCSVYISHYLDVEQWITVGLILVNMLAWLIVGLKSRITYLIVTSSFGIFMTIIYYFTTSYLLSL